MQLGVDVPAVQLGLAVHLAFPALESLSSARHVPHVDVQGGGGGVAGLPPLSGLPPPRPLSPEAALGVGQDVGVENIDAGDNVLLSTNCTVCRTHSTHETASHSQY